MPETASSRCLLRRRLLRALLLGALSPLAVPASTFAQGPVAAPPHVIDGPSAAIVGHPQLAVARDGTGGLVYLKTVDGVQHAFVSRLVGGAFQSPVEIDAGLSGGTSQAVLAAANNGLLEVALVNGGELYTVGWLNAASAQAGPSPLAGGAANPAISMSSLGKAYLAFTQDGAGGHDVRCAYYVNGAWALAGGALDASVSDDAGSGSGRPAVTAAGDGVGIVAWGEAGHIYTRRVWQTAPSTVFEQADVPSLPGWTETAADEPAISAGGDSSYAAVAFHEVLSQGSSTQSRVLMRRLVASQYDPVSNADGLTPGSGNADQPQVAATEYGQGLVTSADTDSNAVDAMQMASNEAPGAVQQVSSEPNASLPFAVPTSAGLRSALVAWQHDPGAFGAPEIRTRFFSGAGFDAEQVVSAPSLGQTDAADGLDAAGDGAADAAVTWVQGSPGALAIVVAQLYQPPGSFGPLQRFQYARHASVTLSWSAARQAWGAASYTVTVDGQPVARTPATSITVPGPLSQGAHSWAVTATNPAGLSRSSATATVFVDTIAPKAQVRLRGARVAGAELRLVVHAVDASPLGRAGASGIKRVKVAWGDGSSSGVHGSSGHAYGKAGRYKIVVLVSDRAGNKTRVTLKIKISSRRRHRHGHH